MKKPSAGILVYRSSGKEVEVLLVHPGGPFWARKDSGAWSIPKGEFDEDEQPLTGAKREFKEELGQDPPDGEFIELGTFKRPDGKVIHAWAVEGNLDASQVKSNHFEMEWPPKSGQMQSFPEVDRAAWFKLNAGTAKMHKGQAVFLSRLAEKLKIKLSKPTLPQQPSLF